MKSIRFITAVLAVLLAVSLFGCGSGETGGTVTLEVDGKPADYSRSSYGGYDTLTSSGRVSSVVGRGPGALHPRITIYFPGTSPRTFASPTGGASIFWTPAGGPVYTASDTEEGTAYTINVTKYGAVGECIEGTFSANLPKGHTIRNGYFSVIRKK